MALRKEIIIQTWVRSNNIDTVFTLDLLNDPYWIGSHTTSGIGGRITNWFADPNSTSAPPVGVAVVEGALSAVLDGTVVTVAVTPQPLGHRYIITLNLLFDDLAVAPPVSLQPPVNTAAPAISGPGGAINAVVGDMLSCTTGEWDNMQEIPHSYTYQWIRMNASDFTQESTGGVDADYTLVTNDSDHLVFCYLTATNSAGSASISSNQITVTGGTSG